jgi:uncharacterized protein YbcC (UPF0753/DUF2309 family)
MSPPAALAQQLRAPPHDPEAQLDQVLDRVLARVAPCWPLDRFIAVNPLWGTIDTPMADVGAQLASLSGARLLMPRAWYRAAYREGRLRDEHLRAALRHEGSHRSVADLRALLNRDEPTIEVRERVADLVDASPRAHPERTWRELIVHHVSQFCASYFDEGQAQLGPDRSLGLYASWKDAAQHDRGPELRLGATWFRAQVHGLPSSARALIISALKVLEVPEAQHEPYLWSLLLDQLGWASWCAYRRWSARLQGGSDEALLDLLAIRLAFEQMLYQRGCASLPTAWAAARARWPSLDQAAARARPDDWLLQTATEIAWREPLLRELPAGLRTPRPAQPSAQLVFCIDVRSEVYRRALEQVAPSVQTLGFAGFFGLPADYQPFGAAAARPQLPGLLAPRVRVHDQGERADGPHRRARAFDLAERWRTFKADPLSTFTYVEALGLTYAGALLVDSLGWRRPTRVEHAHLTHEAALRRKPRLSSAVDGSPLSPDDRCALALSMLRGMGLTRDFARLVVLTGHGSEARNNPHRAGLDCGACGGHTGEINARAAAALLNEPAVREGLRQRGVAVPDHTHFLGALHNTTTDEVELFDLDELPSLHREDLDALRAGLRAAGVRARRERASRLGLPPATPSALHTTLRARAADWAEVRPEWGLANNAALIVAPRHHCRHLDLAGRAFLHDYDHHHDQHYAVLEQIMTAPMLVTHWINAQYYASTVDNLRFGCGNKVLHNVVGGHLGVFEGNGGDLRIGLPLQSLHDGERWLHTPLRLSVFIEAPRDAIDAVLNRHPHLRALVSNGWISLLQIDDLRPAPQALAPS